MPAILSVASLRTNIGTSRVTAGPLTVTARNGRKREKSMRKHLEETLKSLNQTFNMGELLSIDRSSRTFTIMRAPGWPEVRRYRIRGAKVFALGHGRVFQMQVKDAVPGEVVETTGGSVYRIAHPSEIIGKVACWQQYSKTKVRVHGDNDCRLLTLLERF
jgi:hypothetical protein